MEQFGSELAWVDTDPREAKIYEVQAITFSVVRGLGFTNSGVPDSNFLA